MARDGQPAVKVLALETDLFFAVKVQDTLKRAGYETRITRSTVEFATLLLDGGYALGLVDFAARGVDWRAGVQAARTAGIPVIVFGPHVDLETHAEARSAGATRVIANSRLGDLPGLISRIVTRTDDQGAPDGGLEGVPPPDGQAEM